MGKSYKNFWSLNMDEAVVTTILRDHLENHLEVFMPLNAQLKDIDLIIVNTKNKKVATIQVKGSRAYEPSQNEVRKFGDGSGGWFFFDKDKIHNSNADYFIFLVYVIREDSKTGRRIIESHTITIPIKKLKDLCIANKKKHGGNRYSFYFWVNPKKKKAFDFRDELYYVTKYLDKSGITKLEKGLNEY